MDVILGCVGKIVVDDESDAFDVETARGDVGGNEDGRLAVPEVGERLLSVRLISVGMHGSGGETDALKRIGHEIARVLARDENENELLVPSLASLGPGSQERQQFVVLVFSGLKQDETLKDVVVGLKVVRITQLNMDRLVEEIVGQLTDLKKHVNRKCLC